jgi:hypothetical protein
MEVGSTEHRLIVRTGFEGADAVLYPVDAGPYTLPDAVVQLVPNQPLPRLTPGEVVLVAADRQWIDVGGHRLAGAPQSRSSRSTRVGAHSGSVFAERGDVVVIPPPEGALKTWREVPTLSTADVEQSARALRSEDRHLLQKIVPLVAVLVVGVLARRAIDVGAAVWTLTILGITTVSWWRVHRRRGYLEAATRPAPPGGRPMWVHVWWMLGADGKPVAVATLCDPDREDGSVHDIPVVCVAGELPDADLMAVVSGDPASGRPITIRADGLRLASLGPPLPPLAGER